MPIPILMPALSPTMTEGTLARWLKAEGDAVSAGDIIAEIETDKATMEIEAVDEGVLGRILVAEGTEGVAVNTPIALLLEEGDDASALEAPAAAPGHAAGAESAAAPAPAAQAAPPAPEPAAASDEDRYYEKTVTLSVREALRDAMAEEMRADDSVLLIGEEVAEYQGAYKVSQGLLDEFGARRVIDTPITEAGFTGLGIGAALGGLKPIVEFMTFNFAMQAIDQIINSASKTRYMSGGQMRCSIVLRGPNGAATRVAAQHSQCYASWYAHCPGLKVVAPYSAGDAKGLLKSAIRDPNPVIFLENEILYGQSFEVPEDPDFVVPIGRAKVVRAGGDVTIAAFSIMVGHALEAAALLAEEGVDAEVIDLRTLLPLDMETIEASVRKTGRCVIAHEATLTSGFGAELAALVQESCFYHLEAPIVRVAGWDTPYPHAQEWAYFPGPERVGRALRAALEG